jgi:hypothetical protein
MRSTVKVLIVIIALFLMVGAYSQGNIRRALAQPVGEQPIVSGMHAHTIKVLAKGKIQAKEHQLLQTVSKLVQSDTVQAHNDVNKILDLPMLAKEQQLLQTVSKLLQSDIMKAEQFPTKKVPFLPLSGW